MQFKKHQGLRNKVKQKTTKKAWITQIRTKSKVHNNKKNSHQTYSYKMKIVRAQFWQNLVLILMTNPMKTCLAAIKIMTRQQHQLINKMIVLVKVMALYLVWWAGLSPATYQQIKSKKKEKRKKDRNNRLLRIRSKIKVRQFHARNTKSLSRKSIHTKACFRHTIMRSRAWLSNWNKLRKRKLW